jgi:demethylmenaquinone methyltransferase/2-methoxy-6-polyprenyl-1,4-benzoquinol methylase
MNSAHKTSHASVLRVFQSKDQTRAFYNKISRVYDLLSERSEAPMRKAGLELLCARAGESVLEIGFGAGHSLVALAKAVGPKGTVFGLDLSDKMLQRAKATLAMLNLLGRARLRCADATQLPYEVNSMDAVFMSFTVLLNGRTNTSQTSLTAAPSMCGKRWKRRGSKSKAR